MQCVKGICFISAPVIVLIMQDRQACYIERRKIKKDAREVDIPAMIADGGGMDGTN
jgi:hypothetical protein